MVTFATLFVSRPQKGPAESTEVLRAQIELSVCDQRGAGTSSPVSATLGDVRSNAPTWLDRPGADLERGRRYTYDLILDQVRTLGDISALDVTVHGDDDLCLRELKLMVNGGSIFVRSSTAGIVFNATTHYTLTESAGELRANAAWQHYGWSLAEWIAKTGAAVPREELVARLESAVATAMHDVGLAWRADASEPLRLRRRSDNVVGVTAALVRPVGYWRDDDVVLDFDLTLCRDGRPAPAITNVAIREAKPWYSQVLNLRTSDDEARLLEALRAKLAQSRPLVMAGGVCPRVDQSVNLLF